jgi:hypothetical protein
MGQSRYQRRPTSLRSGSGLSGEYCLQQHASYTVYATTRGHSSTALYHCQRRISGVVDHPGMVQIRPLTYRDRSARPVAGSGVEGQVKRPEPGASCFSALRSVFIKDALNAERVVG